MRIGLAIKKSPKSKEGLDAIGLKDLVVIDLNTGEELEEKISLLWGSKSLLTEGGDPLLTEEYFEDDPEDASYLVVIVRCDAAINA